MSKIFEKLEGYKTIIAGWITALAPAFLMLGIDIDPEAVIEWIGEWNKSISGLLVLGGAAIHYFRNLAKKKQPNA